MSVQEIKGGFPSFWLEGWGYRGQKGRRPVCCPLSKRCPDDRHPSRLSSDSQHRRGLNAGTPGTGLAAQNERLRGISVGEFFEIQQPRDKIQQAEAGRSAIPGSPPRDTWAGETTRAPRPRTLAGLWSGGRGWAALSKTHDVLSRRSPWPSKKHKNCVPVTRTHFLLLVLTRPSFRAPP